MSISKFCAVVFVALTSAVLLAQQADAQRLNASSSVSTQDLLPVSTKAWLSIPDANRLDEKFLETQLGRLSKDEAFAPFIESLKKQCRNWLSEKNLRLGLDFDGLQDIRSGEICVAGILPTEAADQDNELGRSAHGMVLLVDVSQHLDEARDLLDRLSDELTERGATREEYGEVHGAIVTKWKFPKQSRLKKNRYAYQTITGGWLLSSDNETIFRDIVRRLVNIDNVKKGETLSARPAFRNVMDQVHLDSINPEVRWFVDPFGYLQLAQAIEREEQEFRQRNSDDWARILRENGFDGFKGIGGFVALSTGKHEILHRTFVYKPVVDTIDKKQKRVFGLFDFENKHQKVLTPPGFVPEDVAAYFSASWDIQRAFKNVGHAVDTFAKEEGSFEKALETTRIEMDVDVSEVISKFDDQIFVISDVSLPVQVDSEQIAIVVPLKGDHDYVYENIKKSWPHQHREFELAGHKIVEIDDSIGAEELDFDEDDIWSDPEFNGEEEVVEEEADEPTFSLFAKRFCATTEDYLFIANNQEFLSKLLARAEKRGLSNAADYQRVATSLDEIVEAERVSFRQFERIDRVIRTNYEMLRDGKMAASNTVLARILNQVFISQDENSDKVRQQQIDASQLPSDFENQVAPYLGPAGWVMETTKDGWLVTGCLLEKQEVENQVVKKEDANSHRK